jgi:hypothetical protein
MNGAGTQSDRSVVLADRSKDLGTLEDLPRLQIAVESMFTLWRRILESEIGAKTVDWLAVFSQKEQKPRSF